MVSSTKKVLIVSLGPYPDWGTNSNLFKRILFDGHLIDKLGSVDVLTFKHSHYDLSEEMVNGVRVHRIFSWRRYAKNDLLRFALRHPVKVAVGLVEKIYHKYLMKLFKDCYFDSGVVNDVYSELHKLNSSIVYDCVVVLVCPYEAAIAVAKYSSETGMKFVLWQCDPCSTNALIPQKYHEEALRVERELFISAKVVFTLPTIYEELKEKWHFFGKNNAILMDLPLIVTRKLLQKSICKTGPLVCVFVGNIYGNIRDPRYTLALFSKLDTRLIQLHMYGSHGGTVNSSKVICHGSVTLNDALKAEDEADFLVNIGNLMTNQVPSKIFEYISTGKPIINVCKNRNCPTLPYLEKYPLALNLYEEDDIFDEQVEKLNSFIKDNVGKRVDFAQIEQMYKKCTPGYCADMMLRAIEE